MLTLKLISEETERVIKGLNKKHFAGAEEAINEVLATNVVARRSRNLTETFQKPRRWQLRLAPS